MSNLRYGIPIILILILVACQPEEEILPTLVDLEATNQAQAIIQTEAAIAQEETALAPTATSLRPTLPPTFTPTPDIEPLLPTINPAITSTPEGYSRDGTIYYNYNGDSIARIFPDGTGNEIILTFGVDQPITDLTASPDGELLAFVAASSGSAREVWVTNRDGSYLQQVSCLGFGEVRSPSFAPDSNRIAFFAAPLATTEMALYVVDFIGSNDCPTGNNQQILFPLSTTLTGDIAWNASSDMIYYNAAGTYVYDFATQAVYVISGEAGFASDFAANYHIPTNQMAYLRYQRNLSTGEEGGSLIVIDDADDFRAEYVLNELSILAFQLDWGKNGESLLYATKDSIISYDLGRRSTIVLKEGLSNPLLAYAPNREVFVYTAIDPETNVIQLYRRNRIDSREEAKITNNPEGHITSVLWLEG